MRILQCIVGLGCVLLLTGCPSGEINGIHQPPQPVGYAVYTHEPSGFRFPWAIGGVARDKVKQYDAEGREISVSYHLLQSENLMIFVSPVKDSPPDDTLEGYFAKRVQELQGQLENVKKVTDEPVEMTVSDKMRKGQHAAFTHRGMFAQRPQLLRTDLFVFSNGKWFFTYQATYPQSEREQGERVFVSFAEILAWPKEEKQDKEKQDKKVQEKKDTEKPDHEAKGPENKTK